MSNFEYFTLSIILPFWSFSTLIQYNFETFGNFKVTKNIVQKLEADLCLSNFDYLKLSFICTFLIFYYFSHSNNKFSELNNYYCEIEINRVKNISVLFSVLLNIVNFYNKFKISPLYSLVNFEYLMFGTIFTFSSF